MFTGKQAGNCEEAIRFYASVFHDSRVGDMNRYGSGEDGDQGHEPGHLPNLYPVSARHVDAHPLRKLVRRIASPILAPGSSWTARRRT